MSKINALQNFDTTETELRHLQVVYLNENGFSSEEISKWTGYAVATVKSYVKKFSYLLNTAKEIFYRITLKCKTVLRGGRQLVYLYKFYNENNELICSKVGTTTRLPEQRLKEEIKYYRKRDIPVDHAEICSVIDCGQIPAEGAESITRALFIQRFPTAFKKNDRFFGVDIPTRTFNKFVSNYLAGATLGEVPA